MPYQSFTDEQLRETADRVRARSHNAPKCLSGPDNAPTVNGDAWSRFAAEWMDIRAELLRREKGIR